MKITEFLTHPGHVYVDMDGVVAGCNQGLADHFGVSCQTIIDAGWDGPHWHEMYTKEPKVLEQFFADLPWETNGKKLLGWLNSNGIPWTFLTRPMKQPYTEATIEGKKLWLAKEGLSEQPVIYEFAKEKYASAPGVANILIDDLALNITEWERNGGIGLLYDDASCDDTLRQLAKILKV